MTQEKIQKIMEKASQKVSGSHLAKIKAILDAIASCKVTAREIEPTRRGTTINTDWVNGKGLHPDTIDRLYGSLSCVFQEKQEQPQEQPQEVIQPITKDNKVDNKTSEDGKVSDMQATIEKMQATMNKMQSEIDAQKATIQLLSTKVEAIQPVTKDNKTDNKPSPLPETTQNFVSDGESFLGFTIRLEKTSVNVDTYKGVTKCEYKKYYAKKRISGKLHRIYLGETCTKEVATEKIKTYCQKYGIGQVQENQASENN